MKYVIMIVIILAVSFLCGAVLAVIASDDEWEQLMDDKEQEEFLKKWNEKQKRS